jgi:hypothetical protein
MNNNENCNYAINTFCRVSKSVLLYNLKVLKKLKFSKRVEKKIETIWIDMYIETNNRYVDDMKPEARKRLIQVIDKDVRRFDCGTILGQEMNEVGERALLALISDGDKSKNDHMLAVKAAKPLPLSTRVAIVVDAGRYRGLSFAMYASNQLGIRLNKGEIGVYSL